MPCFGGLAVPLGSLLCVWFLYSDVSGFFLQCIFFSEGQEELEWERFPMRLQMGRILQIGLEQPRQRVPLHSSLWPVLSPDTGLVFQIGRFLVWSTIWR